MAAAAPKRSASRGIGMFVGIFLGSTAIGLLIGLLAATIFRSRYFYSGPVLIQGRLDSGSTGMAEVNTPGSNSTFEVGLAVVFAYGSYLVADAARCSGIVAVVVNGMVMNMYVRPNLSEAAQHKIETLFKTLAGLFELFVFCYIGTTMFLQDEEFNILGYTALSLIALAVSRAANILPCTALVNWLRPIERHISPAQQFMLWWSGLRGAMAFALSVEADERFGQYGKVMKTCTFYLVFITVLFNGGTCAYLLRRLGLRAEDTPALILRLQDSLAHMHGFGSADCRGPDTTTATTTATTTTTNNNNNTATTTSGVGAEKEGTVGKDSRPRPGVGGGGGGGPRRSLSAPFREGLRPFRGRRALAALPSPKVLLEKVRSLNDGRLVDRFDEFDRRVSRLLIHPDALREATDLSLITTTSSSSSAIINNNNGGGTSEGAGTAAATAARGTWRSGLGGRRAVLLEVALMWANPWQQWPQLTGDQSVPQVTVAAVAGPPFLAVVVNEAASSSAAALSTSALHA
ncbi:hypothetical protein VOLCADRAFT_90258 [Volvox carteri f. nagariensis]|uniref:Cation/H+ exchanger transmembrane domain-containing protein n=1 Tax=Volvox carteri f. nagariensis TaxID=3068 RepID=D8TTW5_VOLCA|nr:uncharacterized protein VOLCADRAFT_90258 [Volvox carteri f. nagariensis]EFJ48936.1 hypothetical protein VOLCADRAFT_90258 [Volvox carteri f. nagariensis]|eukprot:XP_002949833.1 hypothetical protein VOLCADRAFT_90258 [Volvox carteri f. nagariensis]